MTTGNLTVRGYIATVLAPTLLPGVLGPVVLNVTNGRVLYMVFNIGPVRTKVDGCFLETHTSFESPGFSD